MSEMIERVAKALKAAKMDAHLSGDPDVILARAAIEAMREPTDAMVEAGCRFTDHNTAREVYDAAIVDALK